MKIFYDCEFLEDGKTIELISIALVAEDGREMYLVNRDAPWKRIKKDEWLMANVVPSLPQPHGDWILHMPKSWPIDFHNGAVKDRAAIATEVQEFLQATPDLELWADYGAYDHVVLCQLFGRMIDLPDGVPMFTNDLRQEVRRLGNPQLPEQQAGVHNALEDARHLKACAEWLAAREAADDWDRLRRCPSMSPAMPVPTGDELQLSCEHIEGHRGAHGAYRYLTSWRDQGPTDTASNSGGAS